MALTAMQTRDAAHFKLNDITREFMAGCYESLKRSTVPLTHAQLEEATASATRHHEAKGFAVFRVRIPCPGCGQEITGNNVGSVGSVERPKLQRAALFLICVPCTVEVQWQRRHANEPRTKWQKRSVWARKFWTTARRLVDAL
jgi:hypothetical protein